VGTPPGLVGKLARWLCTYPKEKSGFVRFSEQKSPFEKQATCLMISEMEGVAVPPEFT